MFPSSFGKVLKSSIFADTEHAHDQLTCRSLTGMIGYVGITPVTWERKRQGSIASITYASEFSALRTAAEWAQNISYILRSLG